MLHNEMRRLPGFDNVAAVQLDEDRLALSVMSGPDTAIMTIVDRRDYGSDPEFVQECTQWARRWNGRPCTPWTAAGAVADRALQKALRA